MSQLGEFDLIERYFAPRYRDDELVLGVGDDAAIIRPPAGHDLAVTVDTMVAGVHFAPNTAPSALGHKALAVSLSDLAAMGATPRWVTLALTLPEIDPAWLAEFAAGFLALIEQSGSQLVGGDTTCGPLTISVQVQGLLPTGKGLRRSGARVGDLVCVTGTLGDAALALALEASEQPVAEDISIRLQQPTARLQAGKILLDFATAAVDISDGLVADLGHVLKASGVGARIDLQELPLSESFINMAPSKSKWLLSSSIGDDYELCFTLPPQIEPLLRQQELGVDWRVIGIIETGSELQMFEPDGTQFEPAQPGFDHFGHFNQGR